MLNRLVYCTSMLYLVCAVSLFSMESLESGATRSSTTSATDTQDIERQVQALVNEIKQMTQAEIQATCEEMDSTAKRNRLFKSMSRTTEDLDEETKKEQSVLALVALWQSVITQSARYSDITQMWALNQIRDNIILVKALLRLLVEWRDDQNISFSSNDPVKSQQAKTKLYEQFYEKLFEAVISLYEHRSIANNVATFLIDDYNIHKLRERAVLISDKIPSAEEQDSSASTSSENLNPTLVMITEPILNTAVREGNVPAIRFLLRYGAELNGISEYRRPNSDIPYARINTLDGSISIPFQKTSSRNNSVITITWRC